MAWSICRFGATAPLLLVFCLTGPAARAEAPTGEPARAAAQAKLIEGVAQLKRGDYLGALATFQGAYRLVPSPNIHYNLALAYAGLGRSADALEAFERFLAEAPNAPPATRRKAKADAETMRSRVAAVVISADGSGAEIVVDGLARGVTPLSRPLYLEPGQHEIAARGPTGIVGPVQTVVVEAGASANLTLTVPAPIVAGAPGEAIAAEGRGRAAPPAAAGAAMLARPEPRPETRPETGPETRPAATRTARIWVLSSTALGVALLAAGGTFALLARQEGESLTRLSEQSTPMNRPTFPPSTESRGERYETLALVSVGAAVAALATGAIIHLTTGRRPATDPVIVGAAGGAGLRLRF